jgi:hypothetical protein
VSMAWVKRNLGLVIGGVIALALLGVAGFYLYAKYQEDQEVTAELEAATQRFQELLSRPVHPGTESGRVNNIELAKEEHKRLQAFLQEVRARFGKRDIPTNISSRDFRALLDNTIFDLQRTAEQLGITLPSKDYWFTFAPQRQAVEFKSIETLAHQLMDVKDLCEILYSAKIHDLKGIKRVPASSDDNNATDFMTDKKATTNDFAIVTPYELTFEGFSSELARVLERLVNAKRCFVVRNVAVDLAPTEEAQPGMFPGMPLPGYSMPGRYNMDPRYTRMPMAPPPTVGAGPRPQRPANVVHDENKLRFVLMVDAVRLREGVDQRRRQEQDPMADQPQEVAQQ